MEYKIKNLELSDEGERLIQWAKDHMPVLSMIKKRFEKEKPLTGAIIGACLHATKETAILVRTLEAGGAIVALCGSNPLSTNDSVVAAMAKTGTKVFAWRDLSTEEYYWCLNQVIDQKPNITLDDGADLVKTLHTDRRELLSEIKGGSEETTTGVITSR
jgi:adenosylhomocysteinase